MNAKVVFYLSSQKRSNWLSYRVVDLMSDQYKEVTVRVIQRWKGWLPPSPNLVDIGRDAGFKPHFL